MQYVKVLESTYARDMSSKSIVETDFKKRDEYLNKAKMMKTIIENEKKIEMLDKKIDELTELIKGLIK